MANVLKNIFNAGTDEIAQTYVIESWHVSQSVDAFTGAAPYDITLSGSFTLTGSQYVKGVISSSNGANTIGFFGTSSWAVSSSNVLSSSYAFNSTSASYAFNATSASYVLNSTSASYAFNSTSASYALNSTSASYAFYSTSASYAFISTSASYALNTTSASYALNSTSASYALNSTSASYAFYSTSASYAFSSTSASYALNSTSASYAFNSTSASYALTASYVPTAIITASSAANNITFTKFDGSTFSVGVTAAANAGGANTQVQFNSGSILSGSSDFVFNYVSSSLAHGNINTATGQYSHAEGSGSISSGNFSHAEGRGTTAFGIVAHSEGQATQAIGQASHAEGENTISYGASSHAEGNATLASGSYSHAEGYSTYALGYSSHAEGNGTTAQGDYSHAEGSLTLASGSYSHAEGLSTIASGSYSHAEGEGAIAQGNYSHAGGYYSIASGSWSTAFGQFNTASAGHSFAAGFNNNANGVYSALFGENSTTTGLASFGAGLYLSIGGDYQTVVGRGNYINILPTASQDLFVVGNGVSPWGVGNRSNAFRVSQSGECFSGTTFTNGGADYAEFFESLDGTSFPYGTVVELSGDKITPCTNAENAIGVISARPSVLGNSDDGTGDTWNGQWLKDVWGNYIMEQYEYEEISGLNEDGTPHYITKSGIKRKINPEFNPDLTYIPRNQRPEWNKVGLLGQIKVLKNQPIPSRWIRLKDVNNEVAIYLVR